MIDIRKIHNPTQKRGLITQINEYGQAPKQIFLKPHPKRLKIKKRKKSEQNKISDKISRDSSYQIDSHENLEMNLWLKKKVHLNLNNCSFLKFFDEKKGFVIFEDKKRLIFYDYESTKLTKIYQLGNEKVDKIQYLYKNFFIFFNEQNFSIFDSQKEKIINRVEAHYENINSFLFIPEKVQ